MAILNPNVNTFVLSIHIQQLHLQIYVTECDCFKLGSNYYLLIHSNRGKNRILKMRQILPFFKKQGKVYNKVQLHMWLPSFFIFLLERKVGCDDWLFYDGQNNQISGGHWRCILILLVNVNQVKLYLDTNRT